MTKDKTEELKEELYNHPKAVISTDDDFPTIIQIPVDEIMNFITTHRKGN